MYRVGRGKCKFILSEDEMRKSKLGKNSNGLTGENRNRFFCSDTMLHTNMKHTNPEYDIVGEDIRCYNFCLFIS